MNTLAVSFPTVAVSAIYCLWHAWQQARGRRDRLLHVRVAYLLWAVAHVPQPPELPGTAGCGPDEDTPLPP
jgi:hypothetical protein